MEIRAVKFRTDGFYSQPFAFGGEEGIDKFDNNIRYRGSLQNYLIDTGSEVILVDTVVCNGRIVMRNRHVEGEEEIRTQAFQHARKLRP